MKNKETISFDRFSLMNRWKQIKINRSDNWLIFGIQERYYTDYLCYHIGFFGLDLQIWFVRKFGH